MRSDLLARIESQIEIARDVYLLDLRAPDIAQTAQPGHFCMLEVHSGASRDPLLRRPLSIHRTDSGGRLTFLYGRVGRGTALLARLRAGDTVRVLGPLGRGFRVPPEAPALLVGGGLGIAPLLFLAETLPATPRATIILGGRTRDCLFALKDFSALPHEFLLGTEDGSLGERGLVTDVLSEVLTRSRENMTVFACGPWPMLQAVFRIAAEHDLPCQVSVEAAMACGTGLCLGCAVPRADGNGYWHVCKEGPVLDATKIAWLVNR